LSLDKINAEAAMGPQMTSWDAIDRLRMTDNARAAQLAAAKRAAEIH
jgi:hypothetical protein